MRERGAKRRWLIIDGEPVTAMMLADIARDAGLEVVDTADSKKQALVLIAEGSRTLLCWTLV